MFRIRFQTFCLFVLLGRVRTFDFSNGIITLPEYTLDVEEGIAVSMKDIICHNLTVGDVVIKSQRDNENMLIAAEIQTVGLVCQMDLTLKWNDIQADAQAYFETSNTDVTSQMRLKDDLLQVDECDAAFRLKEMDITGLTGVVAIFVDSMRDSWMARMELVLGNTICAQFREAIPNILGGNIKEVSTLITRLAEANTQAWKPSLQKRTDDPPLVRLDEYESSIELIAQLAWMLSSYFLNSTKEDGSLVANSVARQLFRNNSNAYQMENLEYSLDFKDSILGNWGLDSLQVIGGSVLGLDSIVEFNGIFPTGPTSLQTSVVLQELQINLDAVLYINETVIVNGTIVDSTLIADNFQVDLGLSNVMATIDVNLELLSSYLEDIRMGALLLSPDTTPCLFGAIQNVSIANIRFEKLDYRAPTVMDLDPMLQKLFTGSIDLLMIKYADIIPGAIGHLVNNAVVQVQPKFEATENASCEFSSQVDSNAAHLDFRDLFLPPERATVAGASGRAPYGPRAYKVKDYIDNQLLEAKPGTDRPYLNEKAPATTQQSGNPGTFTFAGRKSIFTYKDSMIVGNSTIPIHLDVKSLTIENLNHWLAPMVLLHPVLGEASGLSNRIQFGVDEDPSLNMSTVVELKMGDDFSSDFIVNIEIKSFSLLVDLLVYIREDPFLFYRLGDVKNGHCLASLLETNGIQENVRSETGVPPFDLSAFDMQLNGVKVDVQCHRCREETTETVAEVLSGVVGSIFADGLYLHMGYNQLAEKDEKRNIVSELLNIVERRSSLLRDFFDKLIAESPAKCVSSPDYDPDAKAEEVGLLGSLGFGPRKTSPRSELLDPEGNSGFMVSLIGLICILICSWILARASFKHKARQHQREWLSSLAPSQIIALYERQEKSKNRDLMVNRCCPPIFYCEQISRPRKIAVVTALMGTIVLFLGGISNTAATITVDLYTSGSLAYSFSVDYTLMAIVELTWESGGYLMAVATAFVVGLWPMVRQFMTLFLLFIPSTSLEIKQRGQILVLLDQVGKWSMLVVFLSMLNSAAFFTSIESPPDYLLPFKLQLMYVPDWGTYATFLGQLVSYNLAGIILEFHHLSVKTVEAEIRGPGSVPTADGEEDFSSSRGEEKKKQDEEHQIDSTESEKKEEERYRGQSTCLATTQFARVIPYCDKLWAVRPSGQKLLFITAVFVAVPLLITGSIMTSYSSKLEGVLNDVIEIGNLSVKMIKDHSVFSVMGVLLDQAITLNQPLHYLGHGLMVWFMFFSVVFAPVLLVSLLLVQWFATLTSPMRRRLDLVIRVVFSWQATEIYIVATIIGAWQMDDLASYMTSSICWAFDPLIEFLARSGWVSHPQCFGIQGDVGGGALALFFGCALLYIMLSFVFNAQQQKEREKELLALASTAGNSGNQNPEGHDASRAKEVMDAIDLLPVLFTEKFSWLLKEADF